MYTMEVPKKKGSKPIPHLLLDLAMMVSRPARGFPHPPLIVYCRTRLPSSAREALDTLEGIRVEVS